MPIQCDWLKFNLSIILTSAKQEVDLCLKVRDLETALAATKEEMESSTKQKESYEAQATQYKDIAAGIEKQMTEATLINEKFKKELEAT